ncbi:MAG TPA: hypothetical protein VF043_19140, partial [Ktedonobacteraceae bacterium]
MTSFSKRSNMRVPKTEAPILFLIIAFLACVLFFSLDTTFLSVDVTVDLSSPITTTQFSTGMTLVDNSLDFPWGNNDLTAVNKVKSLARKAVRYVDTAVMGWGVTDPWPDPSQPEPGEWNSLDNRLQFIAEMGAIPVITLNEAPWWMKGQLQPDGTTRLITQSEEWSDVAYSSRVLDNEMGAWLHLVQRVAERYMVAPYNVRYFQVWNELKGYYDPTTNAYDYTTSPGDPGGPNARHGYTYMYNRAYDRLMQVTTSLVRQAEFDREEKNCDTEKKPREGPVMSEKRYPVQLSVEQRQDLHHLIHTGKSSAHQQMAARVLLKAD